MVYSGVDVYPPNNFIIMFNVGYVGSPASVEKDYRKVKRSQFFSVARFVIGYSTLSLQSGFG